MTRLRSASFTGSIAANNTSVFAPKQCRAITTCAKRLPPSPRHARALGSRSPARARSTWGCGNQPLFSFRLASSAHNPDCRWVRSTGDPRHMPRDKECPACQEEEKRPQEFTRRELVWQRQFQFWKEFLDKDPYDALFGRSNDMLKGRPWTPRFMWDQEIKPWGLRGWTAEGMAKQMSEAGKQDQWPSRNERGSSEQDSSISSKTGNDNTAQQPIRAAKDKTETIPVKKTSPAVQSQRPTIQGYSQWSQHITDSSGKSTETSGEWRYDAISGRMVPIDKTVVAAHGMEASPQTPSRATANPPFGAPSRTAQGKEEAPSPDSKNGNRTDSQSTQLASINRKLALVNRLEEDLSNTKSDIKSLITLQAATVAKENRLAHMSALGRALSSIKRTEMALETFRERKARISLHMEASNELIEPLTNEMPLLTKKALEQSWLKEMQIRPDVLPAKQDPHFRQRPVKQGSTSERVYKSLGQRNRAFKQMTAHELGLHRHALLNSWARKHRSPKAETGAERLLNTEIQEQKLAMAAFEGKWNRRPVTLVAPSPSTDRSSPILRGEGDMCPNVVDFTNPDRLYKKKAPHALIDDVQKAQDRALVKSIREVYENAYGKIDVNHRQGKLLRAFEDDGGELGSSSYTSSVRDDAGISSTRSTELKRLVPALDRYILDSTSHSEASPPGEPLGAPLYRILTYEASVDEVREESVPTSHVPQTNEQPLTLLGALTKLKHPHKFVRCTRAQQKQGYDIIATRDNSLILKRTRVVPVAVVTPTSDRKAYLSESASAISAPTDHSNKAGATGTDSRTVPLAERPTTNPVDPSVQSPPPTQTGNFASPTGFVNHDVWEPSTAEKSKDNTLKGSQKMRKEEAVFSGYKSNGDRRWDSLSRGEASRFSDFGGGGKRERRHRRRLEERSAAHDGKRHPVLLFAVKILILHTAVLITYLLVTWPSESQSTKTTEADNHEQNDVALEADSDDMAKKVIAWTEAPVAAASRLWASTSRDVRADEKGKDTLSPKTVSGTSLQQSELQREASPVYQFVDEGDWHEGHKAYDSSHTIADDAAATAVHPTADPDSSRMPSKTPNAVSVPKKEGNARTDRWKARSAEGAGLGRAKSAGMAGAIGARHLDEEADEEAEQILRRKQRLDEATDMLFDASLLSLTMGGLAWVFFRMLEWE